MLCEANARVLGKLRKAGVLHADGPVYAEHLVEAVRSIKQTPAQQ